MCPTPSRLLLQPIAIEEDPEHQPTVKSVIEAASATSSLDIKSFSSLSSLNSTHLPSLTEWSHSLLSTTETMPATTTSPDPSIAPPITTPAPYHAKSLSPTSQSSMEDSPDPSSPLPQPPTAATATATRKRTRASLYLPTSLPSSSSSSRSASLPPSSTSSVLPLAQPVSPPLSPASSTNSRDRIRHIRSSRLTSTELRRRRHRYKDGVRYHSLKAQLDNLREITCEFQTECQHQWDTRTEEWNQDKKQNKKILDRIREQRPDCGRAVLLHSASAMIRHLNDEVATLRSRIAELESSPSIPTSEPSDVDLAAAMDAMIRLAHDQQMLQMGGCMITRYGIDGTIMATNDVACQYGYSQQSIIGACSTMAPQWEEAVPLPPTVDIASSSSTAKQLMAAFFPAPPALITPWWHHMLLVPVGLVVPFISRRHTPQGQYEINVFWRQVEQGADGIRSIYSVGWDAKVEFMPIPTNSSSSSTIPTSSLSTHVS